MNRKHAQAPKMAPAAKSIEPPIAMAIICPIDIAMGYPILTSNHERIQNVKKINVKYNSCIM